jgi:hypothetical protein
VKSRAFYEALGFTFARDLDIVRDGELEATNYFFSLGDQDSVLELTYNHDGRTYDLGSATATSRSASTISTGRWSGSRSGESSPSAAVRGARRRLAALLRPRSGWLASNID